MWCNRCQQDVPAVAHPGTSKVVCARCQHRFHDFGKQSRETLVVDHGLTDSAAQSEQPLDPVASLSDWQTENRFRRLAHALGDRTHATRNTNGGAAWNNYRFDASHDSLVETDAIGVRSTAVRRPAAARYLPDGRSSGSQVLSWLIMICGFLAFSCGVAVSSWSLVDQSKFYWDAGMAMAFVGQGLLVTGLMLVISRLWHNSRYANHQLNEIHWQLGEVQRTAQTIVGLKNGNAPAFYAELARGASPQMLLASLRGQLDQLSLRVNGEGR